MAMSPVVIGRRPPATPPPRMSLVVPELGSPQGCAKRRASSANAEARASRRDVSREYMESRCLLLSKPEGHACVAGGQPFGSHVKLRRSACRPEPVHALVRPLPVLFREKDEFKMAYSFASTPSRVPRNSCISEAAKRHDQYYFTPRAHRSGAVPTHPRNSAPYFAGYDGGGNSSRQTRNTHLQQPLGCTATRAHLPEKRSFTPGPAAAVVPLPELLYKRRRLDVANAADAAKLEAAKSVKNTGPAAVGTEYTRARPDVSNTPSSTAVKAVNGTHKSEAKLMPSADDVHTSLAVQTVVAKGVNGSFSHMLQYPELPPQSAVDVGSRVAPLRERGGVAASEDRHACFQRTMCQAIDAELCCLKAWSGLAVPPGQQLDIHPATAELHLRSILVRMKRMLCGQSSAHSETTKVRVRKALISELRQAHDDNVIQKRVSKLERLMMHAERRVEHLQRTNSMINEALAERYLPPSGCKVDEASMEERLGEAQRVVDVLMALVKDMGEGEAVEALATATLRHT
eukprot:TRINITY_DN24191_c0_g2_i1.p1 TRINITY_DN24191_c0_g2~~TRINITY_DN24191_c0_g2_i1.p1  ORF type:complete len:516 (-),score=53.33 TRINITY_DN24191_c0_g2_i1:198-1745(-)